MSAAHKVAEEVRALGVAALYFALWIGALVVLKKLTLAEYDVEYRGLAAPRNIAI